MPSGTNLCNRLDADLLRRCRYRLKELREHLQHLDVENEFLGRGGQSAFEPARGMQHEVTATEKRAPQTHLRLVHRLCVGCVRGRRTRAAPRCTDPPGELARAEGRLGVFGRAECG